MIKKVFIPGSFIFGICLHVVSGSEMSIGSPDSSLILKEVGSVQSDSTFEHWKRNSLEQWAGKPATRENVETLIDELLHFYSQRGFPFAEVTPSVTKSGDNWAELRLSIITGPEVYISQLGFAGFSSGEQKQLSRMLDFYPGVFDEREIDDWKRQLERYPQFAWKGETKIVPVPDFSSSRLEAPVVRKEKNKVEGGLGYLPSNSEKGPFGDLSIRLVTLGKIGREVSFDWRKPNSGSRLLSVGYQDFFLSPSPFYVLANIGEEEKENRYFKFSAGGEISAVLTSRWKWGLGFSYEKITPRFESGIQDSSYPARQYSFAGKLELGKSSLASEGLFLSAGGRIAQKKVFSPIGPKSGMPARLELQAAGAVKLSGSWRLYLEGKGKALFIPSFLFTPSDLFYLGGFGTLRGYPDESLVATRYLLGRAEPRFYFGTDNFLFGFFDYGYLSVAKNLPGVLASNRFKLSRGLGISAGSGRLILAFGWSEKAKLKDGMVYVRLSGEL